MSDAPPIAFPMALLAFGLMAGSLACLIFGLVRRGRCPAWLFIVAAIPPLYLVAFVAAFRDYEFSPFSSFSWRQVALWLGVTISSLVWAAVAGQYGSRVRQLAALLGLALPVLSVLWLFSLFSGVSRFVAIVAVVALCAVPALAVFVVMRWLSGQPS